MPIAQNKTDTHQVMRSGRCARLPVRDYLRDFYFGACGFKPTNGGLIELSSTDP
jgi:hypothetical protein